MAKPVAASETCVAGNARSQGETAVVNFAPSDTAVVIDPQNAVHSPSGKNWLFNGALTLDGSPDPAATVIRRHW
ncbi:hypothetical protein MycrhDRAFT_3609 [Mycolicibacterium rhodesiae JS60]|nr:hypothetical protein MycrhDRAFT_3609 [Mycolicibacterium rhodesiae JS60]